MAAFLLLVLLSGTAVPRVAASASSVLATSSGGSAVYYDCYWGGLWWGSLSHPCGDPSAALEAAAGYTYVGHDEPDIQFYSTVAGSGNSMTWTMNLPTADPTPTTSGSAVANYEPYSTFWFSMSLCDPNSYPFGPCTPDSDTNLGCTYPACTIANAGSALLELQFYPPDSPFNKLDFSQTGFPTPTKWTAAMTIDSFNNFLSPNCIEPINVGQITTSGSPSGTNLGMNPGDRIVVSLADTTSGLSAVVNDVTTSTSGSMVASTTNGFMNTNPTTCATSPFAFHPEYSTAGSNNFTPWTALSANINVAFEIGHSELNSPGAVGTGDGDADDSGCYKMFLSCFATGSNGDDDYDGFSYLSDYADGTANHPGTVVFHGGPVSGSSIYSPMQFKTEQLGGQNGNCKTTGSICAFYPWFSTAGTGDNACVFDFGNDLPLGATGTNTATLNDYGQDGQYNTGSNVNNPCTASISVGVPEFSPGTIFLLMAPLVAILLSVRARGGRKPAGLALGP